MRQLFRAREGGGRRGGGKRTTGEQRTDLAWKELRDETLEADSGFFWDGLVYVEI